MRRVLLLAGVVVLLSLVGLVGAQENGTRAWQQRLSLEVPLTVPVVELEAANPFFQPLDELPRLVSSVAPRKLEVQGNAEVAAYVDARGVCLGAVPLVSPFPGLTQELVSESMETRFEPAKIGPQPQPSWVVLQVTLGTKIRDSAVLDQQLELANPATPPVPVSPARSYPAARLVNLPATSPTALTSMALPRNMKVRASSREIAVPMRLLVHITATGSCDAFVPLEVDAGFVRWVSGFLGSWRLEPAVADGQPVSCWLIYTARVNIKHSSLSSSVVRALGERQYDPAADSQTDS